MLVNGDTYLDINYYSVIKNLIRRKLLLFLWLKSSKFSEKLNSINIGKNEKFTFQKK